jgi:hypothetical protein
MKGNEYSRKIKSHFREALELELRRWRAGARRTAMGAGREAAAAAAVAVRSAGSSSARSGCASG